jgi:hypothetical protein
VKGKLMEKRLASLVMLILVLIGCATEKNFWGETKINNTLQAYDAYLLKYPQGRYLFEAERGKQRIIEKQEFDRAMALNNEEALRAFIKKYPSSLLGQQAQQKFNYLDADAWNNAYRKNSIEALDDYLKRFPNGRMVHEALNRKASLCEQKLWESVKQIDSYEAYSKYVLFYPKGRYVNEARKGIAKTYKMTSEEIAEVAKLQQEKPAEAMKMEYIDKLIFTGANCLDGNANWTDRAKGREIYDMLKKYDSQALGRSMVRVVLIQVDRLKVLFLIVKLGVEGTQQPLNDLLMKHGDKGMAEDYLNCGSKELHEGGAAWARANGYYISTGWGSHRVGWGSF